MNKLRISLISAFLGFAYLLPSAQSYADPSLSPRERAESIVAEMSLDEKVALMQNASPAIPRLGIRKYEWWNEALHGVGRAGIATVFPQPIGMAASFDDRLLFDVFVATSDEARAKNARFKSEGDLRRYQGLTFWTPNVNIFRDPRWGRGHETYGEDPYLTSRMGLSVVRGLQGDNFEGTRYLSADAPKYYKLHACAKHFAVHSGPEWSRHSINVNYISPRDLWETYLPAFKTLVVDGNVKEVMCAYNRFDDEPCCGSTRLLSTILRDGWDYQGIVVSDCWAVNDFYTPGRHFTEPDPEHAAATALRTGTDLECGQTYANLVEAVGQSLVDEATIDQSLIRLMTARFELGEMDPDSLVEWTQILYSVVDCDSHRALALKMARESLVLLKNDSNMLPLRPNLKVGLLGPNANDSVMQWGNYNGTPSHTSTLYSALRQRLPEGQLVFVDGLKHVVADDDDYSLDIPSILDQLESCDVVIFASGLSPEIEGEEMSVSLPGFKGGDRETIELPAIQSEALRAIKQAGHNVVVVNFSGSAVALTPADAPADAILQAWYPGQAGGDAIVDVLMGDYCPSGRLPVTFYASTADLPDIEVYNMANRTYRYFSGTPLYPFGYGLSYTTFEYGQHTAVADGENMIVTVPVTNTGTVCADEVVLLFLSRDDDPQGPRKQLRDFKRVEIKPGETAMVEFVLTPAQMTWFDPQINDMRTYSSGFTISFGS